MAMEDMTNNYKPLNHQRCLEMQPLPLSEQKDGLDLTMFALDLSRKKDVTRTLPEIMTERVNLTTGVSRTLPANTKRYREINIPGEQTAIAGSSAMLSPSSESNSPKRTRTESVGCYENSSQLKHDATLTNMRDFTPNVTMVTPQQPSLFGLPNETTKISVAMPTIPVTCTETSQSFTTHNETERNIALAVPTKRSISTDVTLTASSRDKVKKIPRPFKAYPKSMISVISSLDYNSNENYIKFRDTMLETLKKTHGNTSNPKMRRVSKSPALPTSTVNDKDEAYWERRRKNNEAAKRSRENRKAKEDELAVQTAFLQQENLQLRHELQNLQLMYNDLYTRLLR